ncbi:MAG: ATP-binding cassette domain-containing protein [Bacteroidaceae bacterium]|nr:ATP-binding cassette domain-containing protein [Bacteroidaceae bacterium]
MNVKNSILELRGITVSYGDHTVISNFSMQLERGELVAVTGVSGSGKTSLIRAILGFVPIEQGEILVDGIPVNAVEVRKHTAYLPQDLSFPCEWVDEVLRMPFLFRNNRDRKITDEQWLDCFGRLGLEGGIMKKRLNEISGGQRQRMMLAIASMLDKDIIILDEPTSALDAASVNLVTGYIKELSTRGKSVISVTHDNVFAAACDKVIEIKSK